MIISSGIYLRERKRKGEEGKILVTVDDLVPILGGNRVREIDGNRTESEIYRLYPRDLS